jgi:hypothetical protein
MGAHPGLQQVLVGMARLPPKDSSNRTGIVFILQIGKLKPEEESALGKVHKQWGLE